MIAGDCTNVYAFQNEQNILFDSLTSEKSVLSIIMFMCLTFIALQNIQQDGKKSEDWMWADSSMVRCGQDWTWTHGNRTARKGGLWSLDITGGFAETFFHFSLILSQNMSIVINSGWGIETCFGLWCKTNLQNGCGDPVKDFYHRQKLQYDPEDMHLFI